MTRAVSLVVTALLLSLAPVLALARPLPDWLAAAVHAAPLVVFGGGALLGLLIGRGRLLLGLVLLALADSALVYLGDRAVFDAVALLLPLNLGVIAWLGEASLLTVRGRSWLYLLLLEAGAVAILQRPELAALATSLEQPLVATSLGPWTALPQLSLLAFAAALGLVLGRLFVGGGPLAAGTAWPLVASFLALDGASLGRPASVHFVTAGLLLVVGAAWEPPRVVHADDVTGLPTSFGLNKALRRLPRRYALARVEIDDFVTFRTEQGADAASRMLRLVAEALTKVGGRGRAFYCGAYAFAVVFRGKSAETAARRLDIARRTIEAATLDVRVPERPHPGRPARAAAAVRTVSVTISVGVAQPAGRGADPHEVLRAADRALDRAKEAGQNRVSA
ncbi:MAG: diguanylate cyclase [Chloroflexota bacterium]